MQRKNNYYIDLFFGIAFTIYGCYRLYNHFLVEGITYSTIRVVLAFAFLASGIYKLYTLFGKKKGDSN